MASLWNGSEWVTTRLTDNGSQEFDPVIAAADGKAIAVWRAVQTDESAFDFTHNRILCRIYDGTKWSDQTYTLYNGSAGEVTGMDAELLADGTAAVAFSVQNGDSSDIYYTLVDTAAENPEDAAVTIRATADGSRDEKAAADHGGRTVRPRLEQRPNAHRRGAARRGSARVRQKRRAAVRPARVAQRHGVRRLVRRPVRAGGRRGEPGRADRPVERRRRGQGQE